MALNPVMEEAARKNLELDVPGRLEDAARRHGCTIAGSYLRIANGEIYNTMHLQFPDGRRFFHNKDMPTQFEGRYYTSGDNCRCAEGIGLALCWEMLRTQTIRQMPIDVTVVAAGSCWWDVARDAPGSGLRDYNHELNRDTPSRFAKLLGVPVVHAAHVGKVAGVPSPLDGSVVTRQLIGITQIVDHAGRVQNHLEIADGSEVLVDDVELVHGRRVALPCGFWTVELRQEYLDAWNRQNPVAREYYLANRRRMIGEVST